jgi:hypothetical protein
MAPSVGTVDPAVAFAKVFPGQSREKVLARVTQLVDLLDDGDPRVREAAHDMLKPMGTITRPALQAAIETGSAEQAGRARELLDLLPKPTTRPGD